jgi:hypothetical protein
MNKFYTVIIFFTNTGENLKYKKRYQTQAVSYLRMPIHQECALGAVERSVR